MKSIKKNAWFFCWPAMGTRRPAAPQRQCTVWRMRQQKQNTTGKAAVLYSTTGRREPPPFMPSCYAHRLLFSSVPAHSSTGPLVPSFPRDARAKIAFFMVSIWIRTASAASLAHRSLMSWAIRSSKMYSQTPCWLHRRNRVYTLFHGPYCSGRSRHGIPVFSQYNIPLSIIRLSFPGLPPCFGFSGGNRSFAFSTVLLLFHVVSFFYSTTVPFFCLPFL